MTGDMSPQEHSDSDLLCELADSQNATATEVPAVARIATTTSTTTPTNTIALTNLPSTSNQDVVDSITFAEQAKQNQGGDNDEDNTDSTYHLKWIPWNSGMIPIVMQSINGPCPLIAIMNVLLLREKVKLPSMLEQITESQLLAYIGESIMDSVPADAKNDEDILLNMEQNIHDAIEILPKLKTGLDVNIRFTGITDFEYTPECIIFDLLRIPLYHGWLSDPDLIELQNAIGKQSYNQLVDNIITNKASQDPDTSTRVLLAEEFLEKTASQLTLHGLNELRTKIKDNEIGILFRNNHFLTLFKRESEIYTLVTDHGYLTEDNIIWETLDNIEGVGRFFDSNFRPSQITNRQVSEMNAIDERQQQMVNDYLVALSLKEEENKQVSEQQQLEDLEVAKKLQDEEDRYYAEMISKKQQQQKHQQRRQTEHQQQQQQQHQHQQQRQSFDEFLDDNYDFPPPTTEPWPSDVNEVGSTRPIASSISGQPRTYAQVLDERARNPDSQPGTRCETEAKNPNKLKQTIDRPSQNQALSSDTSGVQPESATATTSAIAATSSRAPDHISTSATSLQRQSSGGRRTRSEKSSKESTCIVH